MAFSIWSVYGPRGADRHTAGRQTDRHTAGRHPDRDRETDRQTDSQTDRQTDRQRGRGETFFYERAQKVATKLWLVTVTSEFQSMSLKNVSRSSPPPDTGAQGAGSIERGLITYYLLLMTYYLWLMLYYLLLVTYYFSGVTHLADRRLGLRRRLATARQTDSGRIDRESLETFWLKAPTSLQRPATSLSPAAPAAQHPHASHHDEHLVDTQIWNDAEKISMAPCARMTRRCWQRERVAAL